jgi:small subunit ribosomal protein S15
MHKLDTGSSSVQIAVMTERILNMTRHFTANRKDKGSTRSFQILVARRRKMMQYLKRKDFLTFTKTVALLNLQKEASQLSKS